MDDCMHLHACRRYSQIVKKKYGKAIGRGCDENCSAYETENPNRERAIDYIRGFISEWQYVHPIEEYFDFSVFDDLW